MVVAYKRPDDRVIETNVAGELSLEVDNTPIADDHRHGPSQFFLIESFADLLFNRAQLGSIHAAFLR